jgi:hypothetical protein
MKTEVLEAGHVARMARVRQASAVVATHGIFKDMMTEILLWLSSTPMPRGAEGPPSHSG